MRLGAHLRTAGDRCEGIAEVDMVGDRGGGIDGPHVSRLPVKKGRYGHPSRRCRRRSHPRQWQSATIVDEAAVRNVVGHARRHAVLSRIGVDRHADALDVGRRRWRSQRGGSRGMLRVDSNRVLGQPWSRGRVR